MVKGRTLTFGSRASPIPSTHAEFDEEATCAAISASVVLPPANIDPALPADGTLVVGDKQELKSLLATFHGIFAWDGTSSGRTAVIRHSIDMGTSKSLWKPQRRIPLNFQKELDDLIQVMLTTGIIRSPNPCRSRIVHRLT
ncbi:hypothetical protein AAHC03_04574 [Spirometra sp. Aus1]